MSTEFNDFSSMYLLFNNNNTIEIGFCWWSSDISKKSVRRKEQTRRIWKVCCKNWVTSKYLMKKQNGSKIPRWNNNNNSNRKGVNESTCLRSFANILIASRHFIHHCELYVQNIVECAGNRSKKIFRITAVIHSVRSIHLQQHAPNQYRFYFLFIFFGSRI